MSLLVRNRYGAAADIEMQEVAVPDPGPGQVLVRVHSVGLDPGQWHLLTGLPFFIRLMGFGLRRPKNPGFRADISGTVEAVGAEVTRWLPGDEVFGSASDAFARFALAQADQLARRPLNVSFEHSAAIAVSGTTALQGLRDAGKLEAGQKVAITGAGGGVGTFGVQIAKALGADVTGICSTTKLGAVSAIGADAVIDYTVDDFTKQGIRYDLILDTAGNRPLRHLRRALTARGTLVMVGGEGGGRWLGAIARLLRGMALSPFIRQRIRFIVAKEKQADLEFLRDLIEEGRLAPVVERTLTLEEAPSAIGALTTRPALGKTVVTLPH